MSHRGETGFRAGPRAAALVVLMALTACAGAPAGGARYVENPSEWKAIDLAEADLNLPLVAPLEIASLERRVDDSQERQEIYTFQGVEGYVKTTRRVPGAYPEAYAQSIKAGYGARPYIARLSLPSVERIDVPVAWAFLNGKFLEQRSLSRGFTAEGSAPPRYDRCFIARTAYLIVDLEAIKRSPDAIDTVVEVLLCGDLPRYTALVQMLVRVQTVEDRAAFRRELAKSTVGTI